MYRQDSQPQYDDDIYAEYQEECQIVNDFTKARILSDSEVFETLNYQIHEIKDIIDCNYDAVLEILHFFNWNHHKLIEKYFEGSTQNELELYLTSIGIIPSKNNQFKMQKSEECQVCYENINDKNPVLACGHSDLFCRNCWQNLIFTRCHDEKMPFIDCMQDKCKQRLPFSFIKENTQDKQAIFMAYKNALSRRFIEESQSITWCPGTDCNYCVQVTDISSKDVHCKCGLVFCFRCKSELHPPAPCDMVKKWLGEIKKDEANLKWILINTKMCPFCKKAVERSDGCTEKSNYMHCKPPGGCNKNFCYVCSKPWEPDHKDHFKCSVFKTNNAEELQKDQEKQFLQYFKYIFNHLKQKKIQFLLRKVRKLRGSKEEINREEKKFNECPMTYHETKFLEDGINELIDSRSVLKWSYCYAYYMSSSHEQLAKVFTNFQQQFECACDKLAIYIMKFSEYVDDLNKQFTEDPLIQYQIFKGHKENISVAMRNCAAYKKNLISSVDSGEVFNEK